MRRIRRHLTYANVMVTILAFIVLSGGTAVALSGSNTVFTDDIANDTQPAGGGNPAGGLVAADLRPNSVGSSEVTNESLTNADVKNFSLGNGDFLTGSVDTRVATDNALTGADVNEFTLAGLSRKMDLNLAEGPRVNPSVTKIATVGPYDISGSCIDNDDGYTEVRIHAKGPAGVTEAVYGAVANDTTDLEIISATEYAFGQRGQGGPAVGARLGLRPDWRDTQHQVQFGSDRHAGLHRPDPPCRRRLRPVRHPGHRDDGDVGRQRSPRSCRGCGSRALTEKITAPCSAPEIRLDVGPPAR